MYIERLALTNVRTFRALDLALAPGSYVLVGPNASGKSNLVEAITLLATTRSARSGPDLDLISWAALESDPLPAARLSATVRSSSGPVTLDMTVATRELQREAPAAPASARGSRATSRRFRVNGVARRASDLIGQLRVVAFSADDLRLIDGPPVGRRRYLDLTISQLDPPYVRALQRYQRVLQQRNSLLRRIQERRAQAGDLEFWDDELSSTGAAVTVARARTLAELATGAAEQHELLAPGGGPFDLRYRPALPEPLIEAVLAGEAPSAGDLAEGFRDALLERRGDDIAAGVTRRGPHRDDFSLLLEGREAGSFASRGQQRTVALALRLAEVRLSSTRTGDAPVLLLDDVLSELDEARRERVLACAYEVDQVLITSPDPDRPAPSELAGARRGRLCDGSIDLDSA